MHLGGQRGFVAFHVAAVDVAPWHQQCLQVIAAVEESLQVEHVLATLVVRIDGVRGKRVEQVQRVVDHAVAPADCLAAKATDKAVAGVAEPEPVKALNEQHIVADL